MVLVRIGLAALAAGVGGYQIWKLWVAKKQKDRINELEQELAATNDQYAQEQAACKKLKEQLAATNDQHNQEHAVLRSRIKELAGENIRLSHRLTAAKSKARQAVQACSDLEERNGKLDVEISRIKHTLTEREKEIIVMKEDIVQIELSESKRKALNFDFLEAWCHLEDKLKPLKHNLIQSGKSSDMNSQLSELHQRGHIDERHFKSLEKMRLQRNNIVHHARLLKTSQARFYLGILKQVIGQL